MGPAADRQDELTRKCPEAEMYFTDDSLLPENQDPLIITAAP